MAPGLVLASASPRRSELLRAAGYEFRVIPSRVSEELERPMAAAEAAEWLSHRKAQAVAGPLSGQGLIVLGADTIVAVPDDREPAGVRLLGKPADAAEAKASLERLSGSTHAVVTGVSIVADGGVSWTTSVTTEVTMRAISASEVEDYVASGEWRDKAGGYAIQETADRFVTGLSGGGFDNVVGLPVARVGELLREAGYPG